MQFTVSNSGTQRTLHSGFDSVVLIVKRLDENLLISSLEIPPTAWFLLLSQTQEYLENHLLRVSKTPNQQGTFEMRKEVPSSVGAQDTDTRGCEVSDLEDIEFSCEDPAVVTDSVYRPGIDTPIPPSILDSFHIRPTAANPIIFDDEEDKQNSASTTTTTPESEHPTRTPRILRSRPFGSRLKKCA